MGKGVMIAGIVVVCFLVAVGMGFLLRTAKETDEENREARLCCDHHEEVMARATCVPTESGWKKCTLVFYQYTDPDASEPPNSRR